MRCVAEESYERRIEAAESERARASERRDKHYPGSIEWETANAEVERWDRVLGDLREQSA